MTSNTKQNEPDEIAIDSNNVEYENFSKKHNEILNEINTSRNHINTNIDNLSKIQEDVHIHMSNNHQNFIHYPLMKFELLSCHLNYLTQNMNQK